MGLLDVSVNSVFISEFSKQRMAEIKDNMSASLNILYDSGLQSLGQKQVLVPGLLRTRPTSGNEWRVRK